MRSLSFSYAAGCRTSIDPSVRPKRQVEIAPGWRAWRRKGDLRLLVVAEQLLESGALPIPARLARDRAQLRLGDLAGLFHRQEQNIFLNVGRKLREHDDLLDTSRRDADGLGLFPVALARRSRLCKFVRERHQARQARRAAYRFTCGVRDQRRKRPATLGEGIFEGHFACPDIFEVPPTPCRPLRHSGAFRLLA